MAKIGIIEYCNNKRINLDEYVDGLKKQIKQLKKKVTYAIQELKEFGSIEAVEELERE